MAKKKDQEPEKSGIPAEAKLPLEETLPEETETPTEEASPEAEPVPETEAPQEPSPEELLQKEKDKYIRLYAEYDNFRKRSQKEREGLYDAVKCDTVAKFLPVYDNLERALKQETADAAYKKGVEMTMTQLAGVFEKLGVKPIEALGQPFDAKLHNAVMHVEDESVGENTVVEEFQKGFVLGNKVIRFSMVKVAN